MNARQQHPAIELALDILALCDERSATEDVMIGAFTIARELRYIDRMAARDAAPSVLIKDNIIEPGQRFVIRPDRPASAPGTEPQA